MTLLLLRWTEEGISRLASTKRAKTDIVWRAAMGLSLRTEPPDEKTVRDFEKFMKARHPELGTSRYMLFHEHVVRLCLDNGVGSEGAVWSMDSTPMWCYGAVLDTVRLLGDGTRSLLRKWCKTSGDNLADIAKALGVDHVSAKSTKGAFRINWRNKEARAVVVNEVAEGALRVVEHVRAGIETVRRNKRKGLLRRCRTLASVILSDLETDETGRLVIARRVARKRVISITDPQARHGRKSRSRKFNGFKVHALGDVLSGLLVSLTVTEGSDHDGAVAHRLITRANDILDDLGTVLADTAYGGARLRHLVRGNLGVDILAPPPAVNSTKPGRLGRADIEFDFEQWTATCKAGVTTDDLRWTYDSSHGVEVPTFKWTKDDCLDCPLRQACRGKQGGGHKVLLHPYEQELRQARADWEKPEVREEYRLRSQCERLMNRLTRHGARQNRAWGLGAAHLQAHAIAITCNLKLLAEALAAQEQQRLDKAG